MPKLGTKLPESDIDLLNAGYRYGWSLASNQADAEDLTHDAWLRLVNRYKETPSKPLLFRTIRNIYIDHYRRSTRFPSLSYTEENLPDAGSTDHDHSEHLAKANQMQQFLDRLRDVEREAIFLSVVEGYTAEEIAEMTSTARGTILSMIHRGKQKLRRWMDPGTDDDNVVSLRMSSDTEEGKK